MNDIGASVHQHAVIELFLVKEEVPATKIHHRLERAYGDVCMDGRSAV